MHCALRVTRTRKTNKKMRLCAGEKHEQRPRKHMRPSAMRGRGGAHTVAQSISALNRRAHTRDNQRATVRDGALRSAPLPAHTASLDRTCPAHVALHPVTALPAAVPNIQHPTSRRVRPLPAQPLGKHLDTSRAPCVRTRARCARPFLAPHATLLQTRILSWEGVESFHPFPASPRPTAVAADLWVRRPRRRRLYHRHAAAAAPAASDLRQCPT